MGSEYTTETTCKFCPIKNPLLMILFTSEKRKITTRNCITWKRIPWKKTTWWDRVSLEYKMYILYFSVKRLAEEKCDLEAEGPVDVSVQEGDGWGWLSPQNDGEQSWQLPPVPVSRLVRPESLMLARTIPRDDMQTSFSTSWFNCFEIHFSFIERTLASSKSD